MKAAASENPKLEEKMNMEDEYLKALEDRANENSLLKQKMEKVIKEKDKVINQKEEALKKMVKLLKKSNIPVEIIQQQSGLSIEEIKKL